VPSHRYLSLPRAKSTRSRVAVAGHVVASYWLRRTSLDLQRTRRMRLGMRNAVLLKYSGCRKSSLANVDEYLLLEMKAEVNSKLGRSLIAVKNNKTR